MIVCLIVSLSWSCACLAEANEIVGSWYQAPEGWTYQGQVDLAAAGLKPVAKVILTGGHFFQQADFDINTAGRHVLDFKNTSQVGCASRAIYEYKNNRAILNIPMDNPLQSIKNECDVPHVNWCELTTRTRRSGLYRALPTPLRLTTPTL